MMFLKGKRFTFLFYEDFVFYLVRSNRLLPKVNEGGIVPRILHEPSKFLSRGFLFHLDYLPKDWLAEGEVYCLLTFVQWTQTFIKEKTGRQKGMVVWELYLRFTLRQFKCRRKPSLPFGFWLLNPSFFTLSFQKTWAFNDLLFYTEQVRDYPISFWR